EETPQFGTFGKWRQMSVGATGRASAHLGTYSIFHPAPNHLRTVIFPIPLCKETKMATLKCLRLAMVRFVTGGRRSQFFPAAHGGRRAGTQNRSLRMRLELFGSMPH